MLVVPALNHDLISRWDISRLVNLFLSREIVLVMYMYIDLPGKTSLRLCKTAY